MVLYICKPPQGVLKYKFNKKHMMSKISNYLAETKEELKHVSWPTRRQTIIFTILVIAISVGVAAYLGLFDYLFSLGLKNII
jgi:preprotein translocase SecE subunit